MDTQEPVEYTKTQRHPAIIGFYAGLILAFVTSLVVVGLCLGSNCNESPVYIGLLLSFGIFSAIGGFLGAIWKYKILRFIILAFGFLLIFFLFLPEFLSY